MTGDGPDPPPVHPGTGPAGTLVVLGTGTADADPSAAADLLAGADAVFTVAGGPGADPESAVLFYAEAWRVERIAPGDAARRLDAWFAGRPGATAVLVTAGEPARDIASRSAVEGLCRIRPGLAVRRPAGVRVVEPQRSPLPF